MGVQFRDLRWSEILYYNTKLNKFAILLITSIHKTGIQLQ